MFFILDKNLIPKEQQAISAINNATNQIERMNVFVQPVNEQGQVNIHITHHN